MKILKELISLHGKGKSTCSPEVSLVNHLASLDNERERMITVISGRKCLESYERQDRSGLLARMLLESPIWFNPVVKLTWKRKVIKMKKNYKETILEQEYIINTICDDLEREGYSVQPIIVPACGVGAPHKRYRIWFIASDCSDARVEGLRQGREDKIHGFEFTSQTRDKIRRLITDTSGLRSHRFLYDKEDDKKQRSTENRLFKKYACRDWDGRGSTQWKSFPTQSPICRGNDGLPFNVDNLTIPYGKWRKESIKAYGNAIVPLIAVKIFEMINKIEGYEQQTTL